MIATMHHLTAQKILRPTSQNSLTETLTRLNKTFHPRDLITNRQIEEIDLITKIHMLNKDSNETIGRIEEKITLQENKQKLVI